MEKHLSDTQAEIAGAEKDLIQIKNRRQGNQTETDNGTDRIAAYFRQTGQSSKWL